MHTFDMDALSRRIEQVIQGYLAASERAAAEALTRAFAARRPGAVRSSPGVAAGARSRWRLPSELAEIANRRHRAVCASPGEAMSVLARELGEVPRTLNRPMHQLRQRGLVRSVGQKHLTRYFPLSAKG